jgi:predicted ATPase
MVRAAKYDRSETIRRYHGGGMISQIEALNYRSLRYIRQPIGAFHVLVGPNASGKSTFLDVVSFLGRLVSEGVEAAVRERTENICDLLWGRSGRHFELAIEATLPNAIRGKLGNDATRTIRYEVAIGVPPEPETDEIGILSERVFLTPTREHFENPRLLFPAPIDAPESILHKTLRGSKSVVSKAYNGNDNFTPETKTSGRKAWAHSFKLGHRKSALGNLPPDESHFPATTWLKNLLAEGVQTFILNSLLIRKPSPPNQRRGFRTDGSNLPWVVHDLAQRDETRFRDWIGHVQTALPDLVMVHTVLRPEDRHRYLMVEYRGGLKVPSWMVSDGTLRLLALTLPAYLPDFQGIYLIEEPENGIHPKAVETVFQSLSSVYDAQLLLASHSPVILGCAPTESVLCFAKNDEGATDVVSGPNHPRLLEWKGETNLGVLFAAGVLG